MLFAGVVASLLTILVLQGTGPDAGLRAFLDRSIPFVGTDVPRTDGIDGSGIVIAVIDTGVDYEHPDLLGWGPDGKVIGGYNFITENERPLDTNGHGTQVAGVIAADGQAVGVAPKSKILAYKVSQDGEGVSSGLIIRAIDRAIEDGADIINISLGINKTNAEIDRAVDKALDHGILVVAAAGNDGPDAGSIGSPGRSRGAVTVGATYNNLTSSLAATLDVADKQYVVIPMADSPMPDGPIRSGIVHAGHAGADDLRDRDLRGMILLAERGSVPGEILYFSSKEANAADAGAAALIIYNNEPGTFLGQLVHEFVPEGYVPRIPVVSIGRADGLEILDGLDKPGNAVLDLFHNPDFVAHFSSRGPVSMFYVKPDIVAPGAYINTTQSNAGYNFTSGTSYAAPHVSGAAALLMEKNSDLPPRDIRSLLLTTAKPVHDAYNEPLSMNDVGAGRLDIANAFGAGLLIRPPSLVMHLSGFEPSASGTLELDLLDGELDGLDVSFEGPEFLTFAAVLVDQTLEITLNADGSDYGIHEARIKMRHAGTDYAVPVLVSYTEGMASATVRDGMMHLEIDHPEKWSYAKITVTDSRDGTARTVTATPERHAALGIHANAEYWIEAKIRVDGEPHDAFDRIAVGGIPGTDAAAFADMPARQIGIMSGIVLAVGAAGMIIRKRSGH